ncbi:hypothetical protein QT585_22460, partial [Xanthomonas citri pv. citri]
MAPARFIAQGDGEEALVVVGDAVHLVEQHCDGFFKGSLVNGRDRQPVARAVGVESLRLMRLQADLLDQPMRFGQSAHTRVEARQGDSRFDRRGR